MECYGSVIQKKPQKNTAPILTAITDGKHLMMPVFMVSVWLLLIMTGQHLRFRNNKFIKSTSGRFEK